MPYLGQVRYVRAAPVSDLRLRLFVWEKKVEKWDRVRGKRTKEREKENKSLRKHVLIK